MVRCSSMRRAVAPRARPRKLHILRSAASGRTHTFRCSSSPNCNRCAGLQFGSSPFCGKRYGRKGRWRREIALTRRKNLSLRCACCRYAVRSPNALRAAAQLGFPSAQHAIQIVLFAPVEYLTYGSRKNVLFARTAVRIAHRRTAIQVAAEIAAEYFDDLAGLSNTHL